MISLLTLHWIPGDVPSSVLFVQASMRTISDTWVFVVLCHDRIGSKSWYWLILHSFCSRRPFPISKCLSGKNASIVGFFPDGANGRRTQLGRVYTWSQFLPSLAYLSHLSITKCTDLVGCYIESGIVVPPHVLQMKPGLSWCPNTCCLVSFIADLSRYIVLNRNGSANELEITSRSFNPLVLFNEMKYVYTHEALIMWLGAVGLILYQASEQFSTLGNTCSGLLTILTCFFLTFSSSTLASGGIRWRSYTCLWHAKSTQKHPHDEF